MLQLSTIPHNAVRHLLNVSYEQMYLRLSQVLSPEALSLFAEPRFGSSESYWYTDLGNTSKPLDACSEDEKDMVAELLRNKKEKVEQELAQIAELKNFITSIFTVPDTENIHVLTLENGEIDVVLSQWGCKKIRDYSGAGIVGTFLNRPKADHTKVEVLIKYSDGTLSNDREYYFKYKNRIPYKFKPNEEGKKVFGQLKNGSTFSIAVSEDAENTEQTFTVNENEEIYVATFPYFTNAIIRVKNQLGELVSGYTLNVKASNQNQAFVTNDEGEVLIENILLDEIPLQVIAEGNEMAEFPLGKVGNEFVYQVNERILRQPQIQVINKNGEPVENYPLIVNYNNAQKSVTSDESGVAKLEQLDLQQEIEVIDGHNEYNNNKYVVETEDNIFIFEVDPPQAKNITIRILDRKKNPIVSNALDVKIGDNLFQTQTNEKGEVYYADSLFENNKKFEIGIHVPNKENKIKRKKVRYKSDKDLYVLKFKKFNWWWLLLLLIPILMALLFLEFEKDVYIKTISPEGKEVANANTTFKHNESFIYKKKKFFVSKDLQQKETTNIRGLVAYKKVKFSGYSLLLKGMSDATIHAKSDCYESDTLFKNYHLLSLFKTDTVLLEMKPLLKDLTYSVIDVETQNPINNAVLHYERILDGKKVIDSVRTNANGEALIKDFPLCGELKWLESRANGYEDYRTENVAYHDILDNPNLAICSMIPSKENIEFFVTSCTTGEPLPDAHATITIIDKQGKKVQNAITNIDGMGRGRYDEVNVLSKIQIDVKRKYFETAKLNKVYTVQDFVKLPDSLRTICLEPKPNAIDFLIIDSLSQSPIAGAKNIIKIIKPNKEIIDTLMSNRNGSITISDLKLGDKISIASFKDPEYNPNRNKIVNADAINLLEGDAQGRIIPLSPKKVKYEFTTWDKIENKLLPDVAIQAIVDGATLSNPNQSDTQGSFAVEIYYAQTLSIVADKNGFITNDYQIKDANHLFLSSGKNRQIYLEIPECTTQSVSHTESGNSIREYDMRDKQGEFKFNYYTNTHPDEIIVYDGRKNNPNKKVIFRENVATGEFDSREVLLKFNSRYITVEVIGDSIWEYTVNCPD